MPSALNNLVGQNFGKYSLLYLFRIAANNTYDIIHCFCYKLLW